MSEPASQEIRARVIEALERRAAALQGEARERLQQRIAHWRAGPTPAAAAQPVAEPSAPPAAALAGLVALVDRLGRTAAAPGTQTHPPPHRPPAPLRTVTAFEGTWSRLRADRRLREALAQVPAQAGPLNSSHLVHRALQELRALSPAYLDAFLRHADTLLWLEQSSGLGDLKPPPAARAASARRGRPAAGRKG